MLQCVLQCVLQRVLQLALRQPMAHFVWEKKSQKSALTLCVLQCIVL